jgi:hypothetical protein
LGQISAAFPGAKSLAISVVSAIFERGWVAAVTGTKRLVRLSGAVRAGVVGGSAAKEGRPRITRARRAASVMRIFLTVGCAP